MRTQLSPPDLTTATSGRYVKNRGATANVRSPHCASRLQSVCCDRTLADMENVGRYLILKCILGYQRFLSPHKGFSCAYAHHTGSASCSRLGYRAIRRYGVGGGLRLLFARFARCRAVHLGSRERASDGGLSNGHRASAGRMRRQRGFCDALACVPCDAGCVSAPCDVSAAGSACDAASCLGRLPCPCDIVSCWSWESPRARPRAANKSHRD